MIVEIPVKAMITAKNMPCRLEWSKPSPGPVIAVVVLIVIESVRARTNAYCEVAVVFMYLGGIEARIGKSSDPCGRFSDAQIRNE